MQTPSYPFTSTQAVLSPWTAVQHRRLVDGSKNKIRTLIFEHGFQLYDKLGVSLERMGHIICRPKENTSVQEQLIAQLPQLVLVTTAFPNTKGFQTCIEIRQQSHAPLVVFTDAHHTDSMIQAYELGADAVISLPFTLKEAETRIMAVLRRANKTSVPLQSALSVGKVTLDDFSHEVKVDHQVLELTPTDYRLLRYFMQHVNQVISKANILEAIWGNELHDGSNLVEVAIRRLRQKIEKDPSKPQYLLTVHRTGYKFVQPASSH